MTERRIDDEFRLILYYCSDAASLLWYQDAELCRQVDNRAELYDTERLHRMYDFLCTHGDCYYIEYQGTLVGDVSLCDSDELAIVICKEHQNRHIGRRCIAEMLTLAREKGMDKTIANIYAFNHQSRRMFEAVGFQKMCEEWYEYRIENDNKE